MDIGIFDSGIGGLTVLKKIVDLCPHNKFLYLADTANLPYGNKTFDEILLYANKKMHWMKSMGVNLVSIACNTTDSVIGDKMHLYDGIFDAGIKNIIQPTANGIIKQYPELRKIGVLATERTAKSIAFERAFSNVSNKVEVITIACPELVPWIESKNRNNAVGRKLIAEYLKPLLKSKIEGLIYGCTHYQFAAGIIDDMIGSIHSFNPADFVALEVKNVEKPSQQSFEFYITSEDAMERLQSSVQDIFGFKPTVNLINL